MEKLIFAWQNIYSNESIIAFNFFGIKVHWYGIMYVLALVVALMMAKYFVKKDKLPISNSTLDSYFFWVEVGVILGARLGYVLIYSNEALFYLSHPWQIFNPFENGTFVGIRGMSYHGAIVGFLLASYLFCKKHKQSNLLFLDLAALSIPLGYFFGRVGNFLNQELYGRVTDKAWGILVNGRLVHPSQLYEGVLEGLLVFFILLFYRKYQSFKGELIALYALLYSLARFICEFYRAPDVQLGFVFASFSMGQILSLIMAFFSVLLFFYLKFVNKS